MKDFICVQCYVKNRPKIDNSDKEKVFITAKSNAHNSDAKLVKCSICGEEFWLSKVKR